MAGEILIYGAGGAGRELQFNLSMDKNEETRWKVKGFIDDTEHRRGKVINGVPVLGGFDYLKDYSGDITVTILDNPFVRKNMILRIKENENIKFPLLTTFNTVISDYVDWGEGCVFLGNGGVINPNVRIGDFVFINGGAGIGHDVVIGDYTTIFPHAFISGAASIGSCCVIGGAAAILPKVKIGDGSIIGAGSVVSKDIPPNVVAFGSPAKIVREIH